MKNIEFRDIKWSDNAGPGGFPIEFVRSVYSPIVVFIAAALKQLRIRSFIINFKCEILDDKNVCPPLFKGKITGKADGDNAAVCAFDLDASSDASSCKKDFCIVRINDTNLSTKVYDARISFNYTILSPTKDEDELESLHYALKSAMATCLDRQIGPIMPQEMAF